MRTDVLPGVVAPDGIGGEEDLAVRKLQRGGLAGQCEAVQLARQVGKDRVDAGLAEHTHTGHVQTEHARGTGQVGQVAAQLAALDVQRDRAAFAAVLDQILPERRDRFKILRGCVGSRGARNRSGDGVNEAVKAHGHTPACRAAKKLAHGAHSSAAAASSATT